MTASVMPLPKSGSLSESFDEKKAMAMTKEKEPGFFGRLLGKKSRKNARQQSEVPEAVTSTKAAPASALTPASVGTTTTTVTASPAPKTHRQSNNAAKGRRSSVPTGRRSHSSNSSTSHRPSELRFLALNDKGQPMAINITIAQDATRTAPKHGGRSSPSPGTPLPKVYDVTPSKPAAAAAAAAAAEATRQPKDKHHHRFSITSSARKHKTRPDSTASSASASHSTTTTTPYVPRHAGADFGSMAMPTAYRDSGLYVPHRDSDAARTRASAEFLQQMANQAQAAVGGSSRRPSAVPSVAVSDGSDGEVSSNNTIASKPSSVRPSLASSAHGRPVFDMDWTAASSSLYRQERARRPESVASSEDGSEAGAASAAGTNSARSSYLSVCSTATTWSTMTTATTTSSVSGQRYSMMSSRRPSMPFTAVKEEDEEEDEREDEEDDARPGRASLSSCGRKASVASSVGKKVSSYIKPPRVPDDVHPAQFSEASQTRICMDD